MTLDYQGQQELTTTTTDRQQVDAGRSSGKRSAWLHSDIGTFFFVNEWLVLVLYGNDEIVVIKHMVVCLPRVDIIIMNTPPPKVPTIINALALRGTHF